MIKRTLLGAALLSCSFFSVHAEEVTLKAVSAFNTDTFFTDRFKVFVDKVNEDGKGLVQIQFLGGPEAIPTFEVGNAVRAGVVDLANSSAVFHANLVPEALAMTLTDRSIQELRANGGHALMDKLHQDKANMLWLARVTDGLQYHIYTNKPVSQASDLKKMKLRSVPTYLAFFQALGASALQVPPGEVYTALERGVVDGYGWPSVGVLDLGWQEKTKYRIDPGFYNVEVSLFMNKNSWNKLDDAQKAFLQEKIEWVESLNQEDLQRAEQEKARQAEAGVETITLSDEAGQELNAIAYQAGWDGIAKSSPTHVAELKELFGDEAP